MRLLGRLTCAAALVVLAACGSSSTTLSSSTDAATSGGGSLTKSEFLAKADALCEAAKAKQEPSRKELEAAARKARREEQRSDGISDGTRKKLAQQLRRIVAMGEASLSQVQAIGYPRANASQLEAIFQKTESAFVASLAYGEALEHQEDAKAQAIAEKGNAETRDTAAMAKRYGFKVCGTKP